MNHALKLSLLGSCIYGFAVAANAQSTDNGITSTKVDKYRAPVSDVSFELKPFPTILSALPGVGSAGVGFEGFLAPKTSLFSDVTVMNSNIPHFADKDIKDENKLYPRHLSGGSVDLGARYYGWILGDSWYTGVKMGVMGARARWEYKGETVNQETYSLTPGVQAGYRWLWANNFLVRVGVGAFANLVQQDKVPADVDNENQMEAMHELKRARKKVPMLAHVDLGLGYQF